jgi:hypothetical protein
MKAKNLIHKAQAFLKNEFNRSGAACGDEDITFSKLMRLTLPIK